VHLNLNKYGIDVCICAHLVGERIVPLSNHDGGLHAGLEGDLLVGVLLTQQHLQKKATGHTHTHTPIANNTPDTHTTSSCQKINRSHAHAHDSRTNHS